jgi:ABC-type transport system involved in multi-copper enzyme maturation permease subunit
MSAQTGTPPSQRIGGQAPSLMDRLRNDPNPIWIRELRQAARLARTPVILTVLAVLMTMLIASVGGIVSTTASPATTGVVIFHVFFSTAYFVVTLVGPAVAANSIASEREGRTWEAVLLTGLPPATIARGKFLAAFTAIAMYIVMLAPVGALPFLFGGVTASEVVIAFAFLFAISVLSVAFGLAISSKMASLRAAILLTVLLTVPLSITLFLSFGPGLSIAAHKAWYSVPEGPPIWLPAAYIAAPFDLDYLLFLVLLPGALIALPAWFLYEVTVANLTSITEDQSRGLKRWFLVAAPIVTVALALPIAGISVAGRWELSVAALFALSCFFLFAVFLFQGDAIGPSRRVRLRWERDRKSKRAPLLSPGVVRAQGIVLFVGLACMVGLSVWSIHMIRKYGALGPNAEDRVFCFAFYASGFFLFIAGLGAFLRVRSNATVNARVVLFTILFAIAIGPWIVAAIAGVLTNDSGHDALLIAAPSPFFVIEIWNALDRGTSESAVRVGLIFSVAWGALGVLLFLLAAAKTRTIVAKHSGMLLETDRLLAKEDAERAEQERARRAAPPADAMPAAEPAVAEDAKVSGDEGTPPSPVPDDAPIG